MWRSNWSSDEGYRHHAWNGSGCMYGGEGQREASRMILHCYHMGTQMKWDALFLREKNHVMSLLLKYSVACQESSSELQYLRLCFIKEKCISVF